MTEFIPTKKFDLKLPENGGTSLCLIGSTRSGKSTMLSYVLSKYFKKHIGVLMTNSPQADIYKEMECIQSPEYQPRVIKDMYLINKNTNNHQPFLAVLDDVVTGVKQDKEILKALTIYRNSNVSMIICAQAITLLNSAGRTNCNFVFLFKLNSDEQIEKAIKFQMGSYFPPGTRMMEKIRQYRQATENHHFFLVDTVNQQIYRSKLELEE